jgi:hypothetical protein
MSEPGTPQSLRALSTRLREAGAALRALSLEARAEAIGGAAARLADPHDPLGAEARVALCASSEHAPAMVEWGLTTTLTPDVSDMLRTLCETWEPRTQGLLAQPARLAAVVLAGNVFTAGFRALALPLVVGAPTLVKASSRDDVFPRLFARALAAVAPRVGDALGVATFPGGDEGCEAALFEQADSVSVYGSDATIAAVRARLGPSIAFAGHGHGVGAAYVPYAALDDVDTARDAAKRLALDIAAYDQRGCLSPHVVFVARSGRVVPREFSRLLADEGLTPLARTLPRGALPMDLGAQQLQWRGLGVVRGELFEGDGFAVSYEADGPLRLSPGYRNVLVLECGDPRELARRLGPLGVHLKALGAGGDAARRAEVARALDAPLAPRISALGMMQTPGLGGPADAVDPFAPFRRFLALD